MGIGTAWDTCSPCHGAWDVNPGCAPDTSFFLIWEAENDDLGAWVPLIYVGDLD